jgi:hypothetical protein
MTNNDVGRGAFFSPQQQHTAQHNAALLKSRNEKLILEIAGQYQRAAEISQVKSSSYSPHKYKVAPL